MSDLFRIEPAVLKVALLGHPVLRQNVHKRLTRAVLFYMYWNCDIGETNDAKAD